MLHLLDDRIIPRHVAADPVQPADRAVSDRRPCCGGRRRRFLGFDPPPFPSVRVAARAFAYQRRSLGSGDIDVTFQLPDSLSPEEIELTFEVPGGISEAWI